MAKRPVFLPVFEGYNLADERSFEFKWAPGFAEVQKKKNIQSLHEAARRSGILRVLEISTKSSEIVGRRLSAFSLKICLREGEFPLESVYQGSKVFEGGGPFAELFELSPREAKRFMRNCDRGEIVSFQLEGLNYPLSPKTAFYDWLYIRALTNHTDWIKEHVQYDAFTDIEFNPGRQVNCQARAFAEYLSLFHRGHLQEAAADFDTFAKMLEPQSKRRSMTIPKAAEVAFNFELAAVLRRKHPRWPGRIGVEQTNVFSEAAGLRPDIIIRHPGGLPVAVETEYAPATTVEQDACERLGRTLRETGDTIEQALAVRLPDNLASARQAELEAEIERATLEFCILSGDSKNPVRWPATGWLEGTVDDLAASIELAAHSENRVARSMQVLEDGIAHAAGKLRDGGADAPVMLETIARDLHQKDGEQTSRMAMAILTNALTFHTAIAGAHQIETLDQLRGTNGRISKMRVLDIWRHILDNINYWPIFKIASDILLPIRNGTAQVLLDRLAQVASELDMIGATSQHDLRGRMFQRLIADRKFLATFYTLPSSAALLAELGVERLEIDWSDCDAVTGLRIGDFACGTGALLNAAYEAVLSRHRRFGGDDSAIHPKMMEHALVGTDIMPAATHLTASVLSSTHPSITFGNTSIITLPYGEQSEQSARGIAIGALDLIEEQRTLPLFGTGQERLRGTGESEVGHVDLPHGGFDLVIMNPPFTRPTNHEAVDAPPVPSFAGFDTSEKEQKHMSARLKKIRKPSMAGHGNAGLASNFIDLAHAKVRSPGGVIALVLPAAFLQRQAWAASRRLLAANYEDVVIITIASTGSTDRAFSADTGMAEVLVIATRRRATDQADGDALFVNLLGRPKSILEAVTVARAVRRTPTGRLVNPIKTGTEERAGHSIRGAFHDTGAAGLLNADVGDAAVRFVQGELLLPQQHSAISLPVINLGALGNRGLYDLDISGTEKSSGDGGPRGPFEIVRLEPGTIRTYPVLWGHNAAHETRMIVEPDRAGEVRTGCKGRAIDAWNGTASRLHFNRDFRLNSQPLAACLTSNPTIGGRGWPNFLCADEWWEKLLVLWANTTLGLIAFWWIGARQQQGRAILTISRLPDLVVLDPRDFSRAQLDLASSIFEEFREREMLPANEAWRDETRKALDRAILVDLLGLPENILEPLALLRNQWCAEPSVHGGKKTAPVS